MISLLLLGCSGTPDCDVPGCDPSGEGAWVKLLPGVFVMGSPAEEVGRGEDETQHVVTLTRAFRLSRWEVTQAEFTEVMGYNPSTSLSCETCPVESLSWHEAAAYTVALSEAEGWAACYTCTGVAPDLSCTPTADLYACEGVRLPTEAEWEYAARAFDPGAFVGGGNLQEGQIDDCGPELSLDNGDRLGELAWYCANGDHQTHPVGARRANAWGLYDMAGNVWEWVSDGYAAYPEQATDPIGEGSDRVKRGGSWVTPPQRVRVAYREAFNPDARFDSIGFRIAQTVE